VSNQKPITHHFVAASKRPKDQIAVRFKRHKSWLELNWMDYYRTAEAVGLGLRSLGVKKGDRVAILSNTRWEWAALDFGILGIGGVTVPIYQSHRVEEVEFSLQTTEARVLIVEDANQLRKWEAIGKRCRSVEIVICIQPPDDLHEGILTWDDLCARGNVPEGDSQFRELCEGIELSDLATIVFTSGTSGEPKGAMITHEQALSEVEDIAGVFPISAADASLTFLPYAHILGRVELWLHTYVGFTMTFAQSIDRLRSNLADVKPTLLMGVPRIFEKIYAGLLSQIEGNPWRKTLFHWLHGTEAWPQTWLADRLIYSKLREGLGGRLRFVVSGGAPLEPMLADFFKRAGLLLLEGYGLTETTAAIAVNTPAAHRFGSVGKPMGDVDIKIAADGEILVRGPKVMRGYYRDPEATKAVFTEDGYFKTGDVGEFDKDGFLRITDRKKDLIKTAGGKYVAPQKLEGLLKLNPLISHALIHGDRKKYVVALVTLDEPFVKRMANDRGWNYRDYRALTQLPELRDNVKRAVAEVNAQLASFETIKNFAILPDDFTLEKGELTPSLKVKRRICDERYRDYIEDLYR
jgi:long-chain acyl-CoA synthetase